MAKFRTKPVEVDALFYTYPASDEMREFCGNAYYSEDAGDAFSSPEMGLMIDEACHIANEGDWVVKMYTGELEVMCDEKFQQLCEVVSDASCHLCDNTGMFYGNLGPCNCESGVRLQAEKKDTRFNCTATEYLNRNSVFGKTATITHTAKSKTKELQQCIYDHAQSNPDFRMAANAIFMENDEDPETSFVAKSKTEDLRDILPRTFNDQSEDE